MCLSIALYHWEVIIFSTVRLCFFSVGSQCIVQMPHWLSWVSTSNPNPSFNLKNCSLHLPQGTEKRNAWSAHQCRVRLLIDCNISSFCLTSFSLSHSLSSPSSTPSISSTLWPLRPEYHTDWPVSAPCPFAFHSQHDKEVCYGGPVKAAKHWGKA